MTTPATPTNTTGPRGTYGCACVSRDATECRRRRYGIVAGDVSHGAEECYCLCHEWDDDGPQNDVQAAFGGLVQKPQG